MFISNVKYFLFSAEIKPKIDEISDTDSGVNVEHSSDLKVGDKVLSLHKSWSYYTATIASFDMETLMYTVNWDDGDPTGRVQKYFNVALNRTPGEDAIGMGTLVLFPQVRSANEKQPNEYCYHAFYKTSLETSSVPIYP